MSNTQDKGAQPIDEIARHIVDKDPSNGTERPGKSRSTTRVLRKPVTWVAALVVVAAIVGIVLALTLKSGPSVANPGENPIFASYICHGNQITLFSNINADAVSNGGSRPRFSTHGKAYCLMYIQTYHWNKGKGSPPGTVGLVRLKGPGTLPSSIGSLPAKTSPGSNGAANINWFASVSISKPVILDGTYSCADSDPSTWSSNKESGGDGFCLVYAALAIPPAK
ncbi:MAG: hypothetical protein ACLP36_08515 [Acidimicrobiales bacterium]|jgi:hypothetical protein